LLTGLLIVIISAIYVTSLSTYSSPPIIQIRVYLVEPSFIGRELSGVTGFLSNGKILNIYHGLARNWVHVRQIVHDHSMEQFTSALAFKESW